MVGRIVASLGVAVLAFIASFIVFNIAYIVWAVRRYPHHNSMAGVAAFIYGLPVGAACALLSFGIAFYIIGRNRKLRKMFGVSEPEVPNAVSRQE